MNHQKTKKIVLVSITALMVLYATGFMSPKPAQAQYITADLTQDISGIGDWTEQTLSTLNSVYSKLETSVLGPLAWALAKALLQAITADIVNWINSGFNGSPAFVQNPTGFMLDAADQTTGKFISDNGPLQNLCSPWNVDIRLAIGLQQVQTVGTRYTCTLGTIINNAGNAGDSIQGFLNGDFSQGGWPAFIAMTTEPENNPYGSLLQAQSDLNEQIGERQASLSSALQMGNGFLSWQSCQDLPGTAQTDYLTGEPLASGAVNSGTTVSLPVSVNGQNLQVGESAQANGISTDSKTGLQQKCQTQTPGSFIANSLFTSSRNGQDALVVANSIDEVVGALFGQLVNTILSQGLGSVSQPGSGGTASIVNQLSSSSNNAVLGQIGGQLSQQAGTYLGNAQSVKASIDQAIADVSSLSTYYGSVINFCQSVGDTADAASVQNTLDTQINPLLSQYQAKDIQASTSIDVITGLQAAAATSTDPLVLNSLAQQYASMLSSGNVPSTQDAQNAKDALKSADQTVGTLRAQAVQSQYACTVYQYSHATSTSGTGSGSISTGSSTFSVLPPTISSVDTATGYITGTNFTFTTGMYFMNSVSPSSPLKTNVYSFTVASDTLMHVDFNTLNLQPGNNSLYITDPGGTSAPYVVNIPQQ